MQSLNGNLKKKKKRELPVELHQTIVVSQNFEMDREIGLKLPCLPIVLLLLCQYCQVTVLNILNSLNVI